MVMTDGILASEQDLTRPIAPNQLRAVVEKSLGACPNVGKVLLIHPDYSRTDFTDTLFQLIYQILSARGMKRIDTLNAAGTHRPMTEAEKLAKLGIDDRRKYPAL